MFNLAGEPIDVDNHVIKIKGVFKRLHLMKNNQYLVIV